ILVAASVIGDDFSASTLRGVAGPDEDQFVDLLEEAERARLIRGRVNARDEYVFAHAVVRQVLHDGLSEARRAHLHRETARVIEQSVTREARLGEIAHHYWAGVDESVAPRAIEYAQAAGDRAFSQLAYEAAADQFRRALDLLGRYGDDSFRRCELLLAAGEAYNRAGLSQLAKDDFVAAASVARQIDDTQLLARAAL